MPAQDLLDKTNFTNIAVPDCSIYICIHDYHVAAATCII